MIELPDTYVFWPSTLLDPSIRRHNTHASSQCSDPEVFEHIKFDSFPALKEVKTRRCKLPAIEYVRLPVLCILDQPHITAVCVLFCRSKVKADRTGKRWMPLSLGPEKQGRSSSTGGGLSGCRRWRQRRGRGQRSQRLSSRWACLYFVYSAYYFSIC